MSIITDRASEIFARLVDLEHQGASAQLNERLRVFRTRSRDGRDRLSKATSLARILRDDGVPIAQLSAGIIKSTSIAALALRESIQRLESSQNEHDTLVIIDSKTVEDALSSLNELAKAIADSIRRGLESELISIMPPTINHEVPDISGHAAEMSRLKMARHRLQIQISCSLENLEDGGKGVLESRQARRNAVEVWNLEFPKLQMALEKESPEMRTFLKAAASEQGATLSQATPDVIEQLRREDRLADFRVRSLK